MSIIEHIYLYILLFSFFFYWGKNFYNVKPKESFWLLASVPILLYSFVVGSRYGWGPDYMFYKFRLEHAFTFPEEQLGFRWLNQSIDVLGLNYVGGYIVYSLIFMTCAFVLISSYSKDSKYMYAFVVPATLQMVSNGIRQGVGLSFLLLALYFFNKKNRIYAIVSLLVGASIHTVTLIPAVLVFGIYLIFSKKLFDWRITLTLYVIASFVLSPTSIGIIANYAHYISLGGKFQLYIDNADYWFGADAADEIYAQSAFALLTSSLFHMSFIYLGYISLKIRPNYKVIYLYNSVVFGLIFLRIVFLFEILRRFAEPLVLLYFIPLGYILSTKEIQIEFKRFLKGNGTYTVNRVFVSAGLFFIIMYHLLFWGRFIFINPEGIFYWNTTVV